MKRLGVAIRLLPFLAAAASAQDIRTLSWEDCVAIALRNNPELFSAKNAKESSRYAYYGSFNGFLPQLSLSNSVTDSKGADRSSRWRAEAAASMNLWDASRLASIRSASALADQAEAGLRQASASLRFTLRQAFVQLVVAQRGIDVSSSILEVRRKGAELVTLRYNSGRESKGNMLRAKAQRLAAQVAMAQAERDLRAAQMALNRELGLDSFGLVLASGSLAVGEVPSLPASFHPSLSLRPDVAAQQALLRAAEAALSQARSPLWPSVSASYTRSTTGPTEFPNNRYNWSATGLLSYPLFGGGLTSTLFNTASARRSLERARQELRAARNRALAELESSWASFAGAAQQVEVQEALLEAARQRNDEADIRYASGLLSFDNWEIIVSDRVNIERSALQSQANAAVAEAAWHRALGRPLGD